MTWSELFFSSGIEPGFSGGGSLSFYDLVKKCSLLWYRARIFRYFGDPAETRTLPQLSPPPGGGGHSGTEGGRTRVTYFAKEGVFFKTSACPRFWKRRVLMYTQVRSIYGVENPLTIHEICLALTPSDSRSDRASESAAATAAAKQTENYNIKSQNACSRSNKFSLLIRRGDVFY